jgi:foldase protein PrsA
VKRSYWIIFSVAAAALGIFSAEIICRSAPCCDLIGRLCGHGHLVGLARGHPIYQADVDRALAEMSDASGGENKQSENGHDAVRNALLANAMVRSLSCSEKISPGQIDRELNLVRSQFQDDASWRAILRHNGLSLGRLRSIVTSDLRARVWLERELTRRIEVASTETQYFYDEHPENFRQPVRLRASHLFLAAPSGTPAEIVNSKRAAIDSLENRLNNGESFSELVAEASEDEATKLKSGDLGYFSENRMPSDFFAAAMKLRAGQISRPIQTRLGFHIIELTDFKLGQQLNFDESKPEIVLALQNEKRKKAVAQLLGDLARRAEWRRAEP